MNKKIISYSLFEPKITFEHRFWDPHRHNKSRYWFNLPAIIIANKILYPEYEIHFYISENIKQNPFFQFLEKLTQKDSKILYEVVNMDYKNTEPMLWRMFPLWRLDVDLFFTRDVDSIPNEDEYRCTRAFESSPCTVNTIRSHENHYGNPCRMLGGLSGFKPNKIPPIIKFNDFNMFFAQRPSINWAIDQNLLIYTFTTNSEFTQSYFYDCKINNQNNKQNFPCVEATDKEIKNITLSEKQKSFFDLVKKFKLSEWAGESCDARGEFLQILLNKYEESEDICDIIQEPFLKNFYLE